MKANFQARRVSRQLVSTLRRSGNLDQGLILDTFKGFIVVEPCNRPLGDGEVLSVQDAVMEIQPAWCLEPKAKVVRAHRLLGLDGMSNGLAARGS
jgi:hypothetical protein